MTALEDSDGVGIVRTDAGAFVGWLDGAWLRDVVHVPPGHEADLDRLVAHARALREQMLRVCVHCGERKTPGQMHAHEVCRECALSISG